MTSDDEGTLHEERWLHALAGEEARLFALWQTRLAAEPAAEGGGRAILEHLPERGRELAREALGGATAPGAGDPGVPSTASGAGREARERELDAGALGALFPPLHDALCELLLGAAERDGGDALTIARARRCARRAHAAVARLASAAADGWWQADAQTRTAEREAHARAVRHDVKTPLQAASLNLELLALESGEKGLDTAALELIQQSIDQAVEVVRSLDGE